MNIVKKAFLRLWKNKLAIIFWSLIIIFVSVVAYWAIQPQLSPQWTGFGESIKSSGEIERAKTLWDWLNLLIVPFVLAIGAWLLNRTEKAAERNLADARTKTEREISLEKQREDALQSYLDRMTDLLLNKNLREAEEKSNVQGIAWARTLTVLRGLDGNRKGLIIRFLYETGLIGSKRIIKLVGADLSDSKLHRSNLSQGRFDYANLRTANFSASRLIGAGFYGANLVQANLQGADLTSCNLHLANMEASNLSMATMAQVDVSDANLKHADLCSALLVQANLRGADLQGAILNNADLSNANITRANLSYADLREAKLIGAILQGANLSKADLRGANLDNADLSLADLSGAKLTESQLARVRSLEVAIMMDGKPYLRRQNG